MPAPICIWGSAAVETSRRPIRQPFGLSLSKPSLLCSAEEEKGGLRQAQPERFCFAMRYMPRIHLNLPVAIRPMPLQRGDAEEELSRSRLAAPARRKAALAERL